MRKTKEQKAITLIALIITIVVLLILAVVVIRAVQGDGILGYAKKARDEYNKKAKEENEVLGSYLDMLTGSLVDMYKAGKLKIGDYVDYKPDVVTNGYKPDGDEKGSLTGYKDGELQVIQQENLAWRVLGYDKSTDELLLIAANPTNEIITFYGRTGWRNYGNVLNDTCNALYSNSTIGATSRSINSSDINNNFKTEDEYVKEFLEKSNLQISDLEGMTEEELEILEKKFRNYKIQETEYNIISGDTKKPFYYYLSSKSSFGFNSPFYYIICYEGLGESWNGLCQSGGPGVNNPDYEYEESLYFRPIVALNSSITQRQVPILETQPNMTWTDSLGVADDLIPRIEIRNKRVVTNNDGSGSNVVASSVTSGSLYINFDIKFEYGEITGIYKDNEKVTLPYEVTENGVHNFVVTGKVGKEEYIKEVTITVNQFSSGIGRYQQVNYNELANGTKSYTIAGTRSGTGSDATLSTEDLKWILLDIEDDGTILLAPRTLVTSSKVSLKVSSGNMYLDAVNILNQTCDELYGRGNEAIRARNATIEDLNKLSKFDPAAVTPDSNGEINRYLECYNSIWSYRFVEGSTKPQYKNTLDVLNWSYIDSSRASTHFKNPDGSNFISWEKPGQIDFTYTGYNYHLQTYMDLNALADAAKLNILEKLAFKSNADFWLASEFTRCDDAVAYLGLRVVQNGWTLTDEIMGDSRGIWHSNEYTHKLCPIVEIDPSYQIVKDSKGNYQIEKIQ